MTSEHGQIGRSGVDTRRPIYHVGAAGFEVERHDRFTLGIVDRLAARRP